MPNTLPAVFTAVGVLFFATLLIWRGRRTKRLPPGPPGYPIIGNSFDIPSNSAWLYFTSLKKKYGDIVYFTTLNGPVLVLNSYQAIDDLLSKRGNIYSDRPRFVMGSEIMGLRKYLTFAPYGDEWKTQSKLFQSHMTKTAVTEYHELIMDEVGAFIGRLHAQPDDFYHAFRLTATRLILGVTYGLEVESVDDPLVAEIERVNLIGIESLVPGHYLVDFIPWMRFIPSWFPFAGWKRFGHHVARWTHEVNALPFNLARKAISEGIAKPSFVSYLLQDKRAAEVSDETKMWLSGTMYAGGGDTTITAIMRFFLAMCVYPEVQEKAAAEIERVVGRERLPTIDDKDKLPYLEGLLKELYRWHLMVPVTTPHCLMVDDEYQGFHLPKGSTVLANSWAVANDPQMYPKPTKFDPERYTPGDDSPIPLDPRQLIFGYGRRICPGKNFAEVVLWTTIATTLSTTRILRPVDEEGKEYSPPVEFQGNILSQARPFKCRVEVRNAHTFELASKRASVG